MRAGQTRAPALGAPFRIVGYCQHNSADKVALERLTHVFYAFAIPQPDGGIRPLEHADTLDALVARAHRAGVSVSLSVGGWMQGDDSAFHTLASSGEGRARFAGELARLVARHQLDGVDIDWEFPELAAREHYTALLATLAQVLGPDKLVTAAVGHQASTTGGIAQEVFAHLSFVTLMVYDADGDRHAPTELAVEALAFWRDKGLAKDKLVLGAPFYSRPSYLPYWELVQRDPENARRDEFRGESYNGLPTIIEKTELAMRSASGMMVWELGLDTHDGFSLLRAIHETSRGVTVPAVPPSAGPTQVR